ncbi:hypothetical protein RCL1_000643 [Eukaryota sp. TZLM3-RCL]
MDVKDILAEFDLETTKLEAFADVLDNLISDCNSGLDQINSMVDLRKHAESVTELDSLLVYQNVYFVANSRYYVVSCPSCGNDLFNGSLDLLNHLIRCKIHILDWEAVRSFADSRSVRTSKLHSSLLKNSDDLTEPLFAVSSALQFPKPITVSVQNTCFKTSNNTFIWKLLISTSPLTNLIEKIIIRLDKSFLQSTAIISEPPFELMEEGLSEFTISLLVFFKYGTPVLIDHNLDLSQELSSQTITTAYLWI